MTSPELAEAHKLFIKELETHLTTLRAAHERLQQLFQSGEALSDEQYQKDRRLFEHRFHVLKGGAGFFKLQELYDAAGEGEKLMKAATNIDLFREAIQNSVEAKLAILAKHAN